MEEQKQPPPYPDFLQVKFPELDPLNVEVYEDMKPIHLMTYRYPVPEGIERKGIVFYIHGFGDYCEHAAFMFKIYAEQGYESFALDQRGFGHSGGLRGFHGTAATLYNDLYLFVYKALDQYKIDPKKTPLFLLGTSLGGLLSFNLSIKHKKLFKGMALVVPFFNLFNETVYKFLWIFRGIEFVNPKFSFKKTKGHPPEYYEKYSYTFQDPMKLDYLRVQSIVMFKDEQDFARENLDKVHTPFLLITSKQDIVVSNTASEEIMKKIDNPLNKHVEFEECDHISVFLEHESCKKMIQICIDYFDSLIAPLPQNEEKQ